MKPRLVVGLVLVSACGGSPAQPALPSPLPDRVAILPAGQASAYRFDAPSHTRFLWLGADGRYRRIDREHMFTLELGRGGYRQDRSGVLTLEPDRSFRPRALVLYGGPGQPVVEPTGEEDAFSSIEPERDPSWFLPVTVGSITVLVPSETWGEVDAIVRGLSEPGDAPPALALAWIRIEPDRFTAEIGTTQGFVFYPEMSPADH